MPWTWWPALIMLVTFGTFEVASGFRPFIYIPVVVFMVGFFIVPLVVSGLLRVRVVDGVLHAGKASIRASELRSVQPLSREDTRRRLGPQADPAATTVTRGWIGPSVMVRLHNPHPVPYWLISSRHPEDLAAALQQARHANRS